eukprot:COSAG06_NODE_13536_length_1247_cov_1.084495_3_plen_77_part_00
MLTAALERWHMPRMMRADARSRSPGPRTGGVKTYEDLAGELWAIEAHVVPSIKRDFFVRGAVFGGVFALVLQQIFG